MARGIRRGSRRSGSRRATFWETTSTTTLQTLTDGGTISAVNTIVTEAELDSVPNPTLIRVRGQIYQDLGANANSLGDSILIAHAIMVVDSKQRGIGTGAMPLPLSSNSEDFLWADSTFLGNSLLSADGLNGSRRQAMITIDSKAMRKISLNQVLVMVTEMNLQAGTTGEDIRFGFQMRMLFKK